MALVDLEGFRQGDGDRFDVGVAGAGVEVELQGSGPCRAAVALWPPSWVIVIFGAKASVTQLTAWKGEEKLAAVPWSPTPSEATGKARAVGRVDHEVGLVDVDLDRAHAERDAADDLGHGFGVGDHVGVGGSMWRATRTTTVP